MDTENKNQARLRLVVNKGESGGYKSGRSSSRDTPDTASSWSTLSAGTRLALTHLFTACGYMPSALANARCPPLARMARSIDVSMTGISTIGRHMSTYSRWVLADRRLAAYCPPMIDINLASSFSDLLDRMLRGRHISVQTAMDVLGCSRAMVDKYRKGSTPSDDKLKAFAKKYDYDYDDLLKLVHDRDESAIDDGPGFKVKTERGAIVGRTYERLPDNVRAAVYELVMSLANERDEKQSA